MNKKSFETFEEFCELLANVKGKENQRTACCPNHDDKKNSLSIKEKNGVILIHCHAGCQTRDICEQLQIEEKDLFLDSDSMTSDQRKQIVTEYSYCDENGKLVYVNTRFQQPNGEKDFRQFHFDENGKKIWNLNGVKRYPYRLPELLTGLRENPNQFIFLTEGEKDCDNVIGLGLIASSFKNYNADFNKYFKNAEVVILADHDESGIKQANKTATILKDSVSSVKLIDLHKNERLRENHGKDVSDWLDRGGTAEQLLQIAKVTPKLSAQKSVQIRNAGELLDIEFPEPRWIIPRILSEGLFIFAGSPKLGKSWAALGIGVAVSVGGKVFGKIDVEQGDVLYLALEDGARRLQMRLRSLLTRGNNPKNLFLATEWLQIDMGGLEDIEKWLKEHPNARLVVIDTLKRVRPTERFASRLYDNDYDAIAPLNDLAQKYNVAIIVVHHTRKANSIDPIDLVSGSLGLSGAADGVWVLQRFRGEVGAILHTTGRDIEDNAYALKWDKEIKNWLHLGEAEEYQMSKERQDIIKFLAKQGKPLPPKTIAELLFRDHNATKKLLFVMERSGEIQKANGKYFSNPGNPGNPVTNQQPLPF